MLMWRTGRTGDEFENQRQSLEAIEESTDSVTLLTLFPQTSEKKSLIHLFFHVSLIRFCLFVFICIFQVDNEDWMEWESVVTAITQTFAGHNRNSGVNG